MENPIEIWIKEKKLRPCRFCSSEKKLQKRLSEGKIKRVAMICPDCGRSIAWLPNILKPYLESGGFTDITPMEIAVQRELFDEQQS